jgi:hypothetical protein
MKFKAYIEYNFLQSRESKLFKDANILGKKIEFTFQDLFGYYLIFMEKEIFINPSFSARELIIPWLQQGNIPELIKE